MISVIGCVRIPPSQMLGFPRRRVAQTRLGLREDQRCCCYLLAAPPAPRVITSATRGISYQVASTAVHVHSYVLRHLPFSEGCQPAAVLLPLSPVAGDDVAPFAPPLPGRPGGGAIAVTLSLPVTACGRGKARSRKGQSTQYAATLAKARHCDWASMTAAVAQRNRSMAA